MTNLESMSWRSFLINLIKNKIEKYEKKIICDSITTDSSLFTIKVFNFLKPAKSTPDIKLFHSTIRTSLHRLNISWSFLHRCRNDSEGVIPMTGGILGLPSEHPQCFPAHPAITTVTINSTKEAFMTVVLAVEFCNRNWFRYNDCKLLYTLKK